MFTAHQINLNFALLRHRNTISPPPVVCQLRALIDEMSRKALQSTRYHTLQETSCPFFTLPHVLVSLAILKLANIFPHLIPHESLNT
jgi:hypothetical protein